MRPLQLEIEGFGAFRERVTVNLADADLFAIVGATGHGKSTLIDAICFTLYGRVPPRAREHGSGHDARRERDEGVFTFGSRATPMSRARCRRKATGEGATTRGPRLEAVAPTARPRCSRAAAEFQACPAADRPRLRPVHQCACSRRARFAAFLHASPGERVAILSALLALGRYDRMAAAARSARSAADSARHWRPNGRLGDITPAALDAARAARDDLRVAHRDRGRAPSRGMGREAETATLMRAGHALRWPRSAPSGSRRHARAGAPPTKHEIATTAAADADAADARRRTGGSRAALPPVEQLAAAVVAHVSEELVARIAGRSRCTRDRDDRGREGSHRGRSADLTAAQSAADDASTTTRMPSCAPSCDRATVPGLRAPGRQAPAQGEHRAADQGPRKALDAARKARSAPRLRAGRADGLEQGQRPARHTAQRLGELDLRAPSSRRGAAPRRRRKFAAHEEAAPPAAPRPRPDTSPGVSKEIAGTTSSCAASSGQCRTNATPWCPPASTAGRRRERGHVDLDHARGVGGGTAGSREAHRGVRRPGTGPCCGARRAARRRGVAADRQRHHATDGAVRRRPVHRPRL